MKHKPPNTKTRVSFIERYMFFSFCMKRARTINCSMDCFFVAFLLVCVLSVALANKKTLRPPIEWVDRDHHFVVVKVGVKNVIKSSIEIEIKALQVLLNFNALSNDPSAVEKENNYHLVLNLWKAIVSDHI